MRTKSKTVNGGKVQISRDMLRRYLEKDATEAERETVNRLLRESDEARREYVRMSNYLTRLQSLPSSKPPERVWENIHGRIAEMSPKKVWFPWMYAHPAWGWAAKAAPIVLLAALTLGVGSLQQMEMNPDYVVVEDINGFRVEAEQYAAFHELASESLPIRESLLAYSVDVSFE